MKYLITLLLTSISYILSGQLISFNELIEIGSMNEFEELMYHKQMRFIRNPESFQLWEQKKVEEDNKTKWVLKEIGYSSDTSEPESMPELYQIRRWKESVFGQNYNSITNHAELFCGRRHYSKYQHLWNWTDHSTIISSYVFNNVYYDFTFVTRSQFDAFWQTIDLNLVYSHTTESGTRVYKYIDDFVFEITDYDNGSIFLEIKINL
jgi:hypothetical protein